jgi:PhnB protein
MAEQLEINMIVSEVNEAIRFYKAIFDAKFIDSTNQPKGENRATILVHGVTLNLVDENPTFHLFSPRDPHPRTVWNTICVPDVSRTHKRALTLSCTEINPVSRSYLAGTIVCMILDPFGYLWQLQQKFRCRVFPIFPMSKP